jgi:hypothetical protein
VGRLVTLHAHADPDLAAARAAAARALRDRLEDAGWAEQWPAVLDAVDVLAEVAVDAAWQSLKRAIGPPMEDGRDDPPPPPFNPDPDLIAHLEGNKRSLRGYRREAERLRDEARPPMEDGRP